MLPHDVDDVKQTGAAMRRLYALSCWLVAIIGMPLFFWPAETERNFAWTIRPPVTVAFLGAAYFASFFVVYIGRREPCWAHARIGWPFAAAFAWLTLLATGLHFDRFHFGATFVSVARLIAWTWLAVYIVVPLLQVALGVRQIGLRGGDPLPSAPMAAVPHGVAAALGLGLLAPGLALFAFPGPVATAVWPWPLTPLTGRAVAA